MAGKKAIRVEIIKSDKAHTRVANEIVQRKEKYGKGVLWCGPPDDSISAILQGGPKLRGIITHGHRF